MKRTALIAAIVLTAFGSAHAQSPTPPQWAAAMAAGIGCGPDGISRDRYADTAVAGFVGHQDSIGRAMASRWLSSNDGPAAAMAAAFLAERSKKTAAYAQSVEDGLFAVIDPHRTGHASHAETVSRLEAVAVRADTDGDGIMDRFEQELAEAAVSMGDDLSGDRAADRITAWLERNR